MIKIKLIETFLKGRDGNLIRNPAGFPYYMRWKSSHFTSSDYDPYDDGSLTWGEWKIQCKARNIKSIATVKLYHNLHGDMLSMYQVIKENGDGMNHPTINKILKQTPKEYLEKIVGIQLGKSRWDEEEKNFFYDKVVLWGR